MTLRFCLPTIVVFFILCGPLKAANTNAPSCLLIYSLQRSALDYVVEEAQQLNAELKRHNIALIDLNNWFQQAPYIAMSGREKRLLREQYQLPANQNQLIVIDDKGRELARFTGSVTLVSALLSCPTSH